MFVYVLFLIYHKQSFITYKILRIFKKSLNSVSFCEIILRKIYFVLKSSFPIFHLIKHLDYW